MADDVIANPGTGGATFRAFSDGLVDWPANVISYVTGGAPGAWTLQYVEAGHPLPVTVGNFPGSQAVTGPLTDTQLRATPVPVSGTVTDNQGAPAATGNAWPTKITDGSNVQAVKAPSTAALASDPSSVVALSPNTPLPAGTNALGSVTLSALPTNAAQESGGNLASLVTLMTTQAQLLEVAKMQLSALRTISLLLSQMSGIGTDTMELLNDITLQ